MLRLKNYGRKNYRFFYERWTFEFCSVGYLNVLYILKYYNFSNCRDAFTIAKNKFFCDVIYIIICHVSLLYFNTKIFYFCCRWVSCYNQFHHWNTLKHQFSKLNENFQLYVIIIYNQKWILCYLSTSFNCGIDRYNWEYIWINLCNWEFQVTY